MTKRMPKKVLCLHGYSMNREWFQSWWHSFEPRFNGRVEFIYPQAPIECPEAEVRDVWSRINMPLPARRLGRGKNWSWYRATAHTPPTYAGIDASLTLLAETFEKDGPIEGIIGWSQGAILATVLIGELLRHRQPRFQFNWAVLCAGALPADPRFQPDIAGPLTLPSLHVIGTKESVQMKHRCEALFNRFVGAERLDPPVGHVLPLHYPHYMDRIYDWINQQMG